MFWSRAVNEGHRAQTSKIRSELIEFQTARAIGGPGIYVDCIAFQKEQARKDEDPMGGEGAMKYFTLHRLSDQ